MKKWLILVAILAAIPATAQQTRSLWVTRWAFRSAAEIEKIMDNAAALGVHSVLFQVRGAGSTIYPSAIEPRDSLFLQSAEWDPLQTAVDAAHRRGLQLHAWVNVFPGAAKNGPNSSILAQHPDWAIRDVFGFSHAVNASYLWLSPTHPQVGEHIFQVIREIYTNYDIDGLHFDYIRFPTANTSYDEPSVELFRRLYRAEPAKRPEDWARFQRDAVTTLLARVRTDLRVIKPRVTISAAVVSDSERARNVYGQDGSLWLAADLLDALYPMIYTTDSRIFERELKQHLQNSHDRHIFAGIDFSHSVAAEQLRIAGKLNAPGVAFFSYDNLFNNHEPSINIADLQSPSGASPMPWKDYLRDAQGPLISDIRTVPSPLLPGKRFKIAAKINDPSGVYEGKSSQGVRLMIISSADSNTVRMKRVAKSHDWFISEDLPPQILGSVLRVRVTAYDDFYESAKAPRRNRSVSDVVELPVILPERSFVERGAFGPPLRNPGKLAVDDHGKLWISSPTDGPLVILNPDGSPCDFSPIKRGATRTDERTLSSIVGMARGDNRTMWVACNTQPPTVFRFDIESGEALPGIELDFEAGDLATAVNRLFLLEKNASTFRVLTETGIECGKGFGGGSAARAIAVHATGGIVFIADRSQNFVQCWHGAVEGEFAQYWPAKRLPVDIRLGQIAVGGDLLYVCETPRNLISIYDRAGTLKGHLIGGKTPMVQPRSIALSPNGDRLYVILENGGGVTQVQYCEKRR